VTLGGADPRSGMNDRTLDRLFDRFRRQGDVAALGEVFDGTASELLRVGMFLSRSAAEAEDLLQATFVTAIERAGQYDGSRALVPWLLGILAHHARDARRRGQRAIDPERLERAAPEDPHVAVEAAELERELQQALASLSARDRSLLEAVLNRGQQPVEIARELGLAAGTVRMQLHRALERLRHALPASLALGGSALAGGGRGFAPVRAAVLDVARASRTGAAVPTGSGAAPIAIGTAATAKNLVLAALSIVVLAGLAWLGRAALHGDERAAAASPTSRASRWRSRARPSARSRCRRRTPSSSTLAPRSPRLRLPSIRCTPRSRASPAASSSRTESRRRTSRSRCSSCATRSCSPASARSRARRCPSSSSRARTPTPRAASTSPAPVRTATTRWREPRGARACRCA